MVRPSRPDWLDPLLLAVAEQGGLRGCSRRLRDRGGWRLRRSRLLAKDHDLLSRFVNRSDSKLILAQINDDGVGLSVARKTDCFPVDRDLAIAHAEEPAEIDDGGADLPGFVGDDVDDPPHIVARSTANFLAEDAFDLLAVEDHCGRFGRRRRFGRRSLCSWWWRGRSLCGRWCRWSR